MGMAAIALGFLSVVIALASIYSANVLNRRTDKLIEKEDARAKSLIDEGNKRTQQMIDEGNKRAQEMLYEMRQDSKRTQEILYEIGQLIAADGSKTRELIKEK